jgi:rhamnosyltransferase subunit B
MPKDVILIAIGSSGDVHPFVGLGRALLRRGHRVTVASNDHFRALIEHSGLGFVSLGTAEEYHNAINNPDIWHPLRGFKTVVQFSMSELAARVYDLIDDKYVPGRTVVAGTLLAVGARIAQEKLGVPYATVGFAPAVIRSSISIPKLPGLPLNDSSPAWFKTFVYWMVDTLMVDRLCGPHVNKLRKKVGLKPVRGIMKSWWYSPEMNICMWPEAFAPVQLDWPLNSVLTGFPLYDEAGATPLPPELSEFLDSGAPPICFTPGSAMMFGQDFFNAAAEACKNIDRRGVLLTRYPEQIPKPLPPGVIHCAYAPFTQLLPRAAALVHHGGIGTTSQAYAAGVPQLIMPMAHDQFDNADRIKRMHLGDWLSRDDFTARHVTEKLLQLLTDREMAVACERTAKQNAMLPNGCDEAAEQIERL